MWWFWSAWEWCCWRSAPGCFQESRSEMARTRSQAAHQKMLNAAVRLIAERGIEATSMEAIAAAAGVSKATLYSHWKDKDALLLDVLAEIHELHTRPKLPSGNTQRALVAVLSHRPLRHADMRERIM